MARPSEAKNERHGMDPLAEDDLGRMIRWGLQDSFPEGEPPDDLWPRIMLRVKAMRTPVRHTDPRRRPSFSLTPLIQSVVVSALLLAFGLGVDRNVTAPRGAQVPYATPTAPRIVASQELPKDMLSGRLLLRMKQQPPAPQRPGGVQP